MFKATLTSTQARNIAMALTMSFAVTTLVTACDSDENSDLTQSTEAEMSFDNQNYISENNTQAESDTADNMEDKLVVESDERYITTEAQETDTNLLSDVASNTQAKEAASDEAETHIVTAQGLKFNPLIVIINSGDTVAWSNMSTHNSESIDGLIPEGAEKWNSSMSENYERTFTQEGIYVYKCTPHIGAGMGGVIIVGDPVNLEQIKNADASGAAGRLVREAISATENM